MIGRGDERLELYSDGGALARWWPAHLRFGLLTTTVTAAAPPVLALAMSDEVGVAVLVATLWWVVVTETAAPTAGPVAWLFPAVVRAGEYGFATAAVARSAPEALPALFVVLAALAYHHYDIVYRVRQIGQRPPAWLDVALLGRGIRLAIIVVAVAADAAEPALWVLGVYLAAVAVSESMASWRRAFREGGIT
jgi:hypothetical protein